MSKRHELVSLRSKNPEINRLKMVIPLTEGEITMNEELLKSELKEYATSLFVSFCLKNTSKDVGQVDDFNLYYEEEKREITKYFSYLYDNLKHG